MTEMQTGLVIVVPESPHPSKICLLTSDDLQFSHYSILLFLCLYADKSCSSVAVDALATTTLLWELQQLESNNWCKVLRLCVRGFSGRMHIWCMTNFLLELNGLWELKDI